ncbi:hypothetical protein ACFL5O_02225 [Myxococcota bacterium]
MGLMGWADGIGPWDESATPVWLAGGDFPVRLTAAWFVAGEGVLRDAPGVPEASFLSVGWFERRPAGASAAPAVRLTAVAESTAGLPMTSTPSLTRGTSVTWCDGEAPAESHSSFPPGAPGLSGA